jgi:hypothetical protein
MINPVSNSIYTYQHQLKQPPVEPGVNFQAKTQPDTFEPQQKVKFGEGFKLVTKGFFSKAKNILKSIVKHPLKTAAAVVGTTLALTALPLVGISAATGAAALAIGFASMALYHTAKDTIQAIKHNKNGEYDALRNDLQKLGGDTLELALSIPFVPKGIKQIKSQLATPSSLKWNPELWTQVKTTKGAWNKLKELAKGDVKLSYEQQVKQLGLNTAPPLKVEEMILKGMGGYNPVKGTLTVDSAAINPFTSQAYNGLLRHELQHFDQFSKIVRAEKVVLDGAKMSGLDAFKKIALDKYKRIGLEAEMKHFNNPLYNNVTKNNGGIIKEGSKQAAQAQKYVDAYKIYPDIPLFDLRNYFKNPLEQEAYKTQLRHAICRPTPVQNAVQELAFSEDK